ncbi:hypothetical protein TNIN_500871 [Trichonephila inaurata madagascariensis]|uniref:Uncharacterized protein n=1 Tax=Trichonephila inaurata madagascariensis TaxID=2747483 RepID=A0A8X6YNF8_9ARAC|nr:hypothetical protein TNIN_500871 [Trichonephila inaurata madagascariensis]
MSVSHFNIQMVPFQRREFLSLSRERCVTLTILPISEQWSFQPAEDVCGCLFLPTSRLRFNIAAKRRIHPPPFRVTLQQSSRASFWHSPKRLAYDFSR